jgi:hypothetical protein
MEARELAKDPVNDELMMRYFLGDLTDEEQLRLEELYFVDDGTFEQLAALEDELIDAYVRGELSGPQRKQFESHFLNSTERRRKLAFAESFTQYVSEAPRAVSDHERETWPNRIAGWLGIQGSTARWGFAVAGAVVLIVGAGLVRENWRLRAQLRQMQAEQTELQQRENDLNRQLAQHTVPPSGNGARKAPEGEAGSQSHSLPIVALALAPGLLRGNAEQKTLIIPHGPHLVRLQLDVGGLQPYESYIATLKTVEGVRVWAKEGLKTMPESEGRTVALELPSGLLGNKDYIVELQGARSGPVQANQPPGETHHLVEEEVGAYSLHVVKR